MKKNSVSLALDSAETVRLSAPLRTVDAVVFGLELLSLFALGRWGSQIGTDTAMGTFPLALGLPTVFALLWGRYLAPRAPVRLNEALTKSLRLLAFGGAALAGWSVWGPVVAASMFAVALWGTFSPSRPGGSQ